MSSRPSGPVSDDLHEALIARQAEFARLPVELMAAEGIRAEVGSFLSPIEIMLHLPDGTPAHFHARGEEATLAIFEAEPWDEDGRPDYGRARMHTALSDWEAPGAGYLDAEECMAVIRLLLQRARMSDA